MAEAGEEVAEGVAEEEDLEDLEEGVASGLSAFSTSRDISCGTRSTLSTLHRLTSSR